LLFRFVIFVLENTVFFRVSFCFVNYFEEKKKEIEELYIQRLSIVLSEGKITQKSLVHFSKKSQKIL